MRKTTKILGLVAAVAVAGTVAWQAVAQMPMGGGHGPGMMMGMGPGMMMGMARGHGPMMGGTADPAAHLAALKTELGIAAQQQAAWDAYAKVLEETGKTMQTQRQGMGPMHGMSDQDRQTGMPQMRDQHDRAFQAVKAAAEKLLPALDDAQKTKAKDVLPGLATHGPGMLRHAGMGMHGIGRH